MPILICVVDTITDDENVRYGEADQINFHGHFPAARLVHQRAGDDTRCLPFPEEVARIKKGPPGINDIVHEQHGSAGQIELELAEQAHATGALSRVPVAAQPHEVDARLAADAIKRAYEVGDKD